MIAGDLPVAALDPDRIAAALALRLQPATRDRLFAARRLTPRLLDLVAVRLGLPSWDAARFTPAGMRLMRLDRVELRRAALAAGAVWHARSLRATILARPRATLIDALGERIYAFGIANADLAVEDDEPSAIETLLQAIELDGAACLAAWGAALDPAAASWFRLKLPAADTEIGGRHRKRGPAIIDLVSERFLATVPA